ncbi:Ppx/GppA phosphatase family protein [Hellea balneolensis]|uniref:Ppx/GppA phosphatase family protein n=1 Tax=Hellea balneolensis TaxID=287478 RepID=UPI00041AE7F5|nr:Ppx/GppA phosphatase family protein [Hellea balneolensis]
MQTDASLRNNRLGVLDIGSNSVRFVIYELFGAHFTPVYNEKVLAGLGRSLKNTGQLSKQGKKLTFENLRRFKAIAEAQGLGPLLIGATAALRVAEDAPEFIANIRRETGLDISPISGDEEARLTAMGMLAADNRATGLAADLGGASLEFVHVQNNTVGTGISLKLGPFEMLGRDIAAAENFTNQEIKAKVQAKLNKIDLSAFKGQALHLIGGAWRNLASIHQARQSYPMRTLQAYRLKPEDAKELALWAYGDGRQEVLSWPRISERRSETLPYSGYLLNMIIERMRPSVVIISTTGLREGLVYDSLDDKLRERDSLMDGCRDLARGNLQAVHFADPLFEFLKEASSHFPRFFDPENETRLRKAACQLAGIGKGLHPDYRASLIFDSVLFAPLAGLTHEERAYLALVLFSSYTGKSLPKNSKAVEALLTDEARLSARTYGAAMRLAIVASGRSPELLSWFRLFVERGELKLTVDPAKSALLSDRVMYRLSKLSQLSGLKLSQHKIEGIKNRS